MPAPGTTFIWDDQSQINLPVAETAVNIDRPVFMSVFTSDKGPEGFQRGVNQAAFDALYGTNIDFARHGQSLLTAAQVTAAGGLLFAKRVVAEDSKLANICVIASVNKTNVQKTDENGQALFRDNTTGEETTSSINSTPIMVQKAQITYSLQSVDMVSNNPDDYKTVLSQTFVDNGLGNNGVYPLFLITDIGRGVSYKRFRMYTNTTSKFPVEYASYVLSIMEETQDSTLVDRESFIVSLNPNITDSGQNMAISTRINVANSQQVRARVFEDAWDAFAENVAYIAGLDATDTARCDLLFGTDRYGKTLNNVIITSDSVSFDNTSGISLLNGSNGRFGTNPMADLDYYYKRIQMVFNGTAEDGDTIYDVDNSRIDVIFDCNYPDVIKRNIEELVTFRQDCNFFEDMGTDLPSFEAVKYAVEMLPESSRSRFVGIYSNYWDILDPYSGKQITVTSTYNMAVKFVRHYMNGVARPFCGQAYEIIFDEVLDGTINFTPKNTPRKGNQKQFFDDNRINYATYYDGILTMDSEYTSQRAYTQLSWINNVLMVEAVIRDIRKRCPINRYKFLDGEDLVQYKADVEAVLAKHSGKFKSISIQYVMDENYTLNKIFYATIQCTFRDFVQSEIFKIEALRVSTNVAS